MSDRDAQGRFTEGHPGQGGRPAKARELAYLALLRESITLADWRQVVQGALVDATESTDPIARNHGRRFLADYLLGKPKQTIALDREGDVFREYDTLRDEELRAIVSAESGAGGADPGGAGEAESG